MEVTGIVFVCVIFAIFVALVGFCCLKFCTSEDKYIIKQGSIIHSPVLPSSTRHCTVGSQSVIYPPAVTRSTSPLDRGSNQTTVRIELCSKTECSLPPRLVSPPALGFVVDGISSCPPIGLGYPPAAIDVDELRPQCPYPTNINRHRTPSPKPDTHETRPVRSSSYFCENARSATGICNSIETVANSSESSPPSYAEAVGEHRSPKDVHCAKGFSEYKSYG